MFSWIKSIFKKKNTIKTLPPGSFTAMTNPYRRIYRIPVGGVSKSVAQGYIRQMVSNYYFKNERRKDSIKKIFNNE
jgi:hypothetical protein